MNRKICINLEAPEELQYHLRNEKDKFGNPIPHRKTATGTDREGNARLMSVVGLMPTVVHGQSADGDPHTLIVFEWSATPERQGLRFREVTIEVRFAANGKRGGAEAEAVELRRRGFPLSNWDPEVVKAVPTGVEWYDRSSHRVGGKSTLELGFSVGFDPYFSIAPKYTMERDTSATATAAVSVVGRPFVVAAPGRSRNNAVRWTMLENESQRSGVPAYLRTAVLLKRELQDDGLFLGYVKVETHVSWWEDLMEKKRKMTGDIKLDHPIIFDPTRSEPSAFDDKLNKLDTVDLSAEFRVVTLEPLSPVQGEAEQKKD